MDHEEVDGLYQDATTPIEAVMAQTGVTGENTEPKPEGNGTKGTYSTISNFVLKQD